VAPFIAHAIQREKIKREKMRERRGGKERNKKKERELEIKGGRRREEGTRAGRRISLVLFFSTHVFWHVSKVKKPLIFFHSEGFHPFSA
jgi:hypothetical protein